MTMVNHYIGVHGTLMVYLIPMDIMLRQENITKVSY